MFRVLFLLLIPLIIKLESTPFSIPVQAKGAVLINADTGAILFEKQCHSPCFPASTTKIATLLYILNNNPQLDASVKISNEAMRLVHAYAKKKNPKQFPPYILEHDGTMMGIKAGQVWPLEALLYGLMLPSGNDAANALAEHISGNIEEFVNGLNRFIQKDLGLKNTHFSNPHGLHQADHVTTPLELAKITQHALRLPKFREIVKTLKYETPLLQLAQHNRLLKRGNYFYSKAIGVKTGYHSNAGHTLVSAAEHEGRCLIAVLMGYEDPNQRFRDAVALFERAFKEKKIKRTLFTQQFDLFSVEIPKAKRPLNAKLLEDIQLEYFPAEEPKLHSSVQWQAITLPIEQGATVGQIRILDEENNLVLSAPIYAQDRIEKKVIFHILDAFKNHYVQAGIIEAFIALGMVLYFRKRRLNKSRHSSKDRFSGRD